jgi:uncharacterized protein YbjT (DUF2867 family)
MKVLIFGATGMVGRAALLQCLRDPDVEQVVTIGRTAIAAREQKLCEIVHQDMLNYAGMEDSLSGFDACFYCLGVASSGMKEADYERVTFGFALAAAEMLSRVNPEMTFVFVSGSGADSTEKGRVMWARVKGRTENALLRLPLNAYIFRPGFIEPMDGVESKTSSYRALYRVAKPLFPILRWTLPNQVLSTRDIGQAMLNVVRRGYKKRILETGDIRAAVLE